MTEQGHESKSGSSKYQDFTALLITAFLTTFVNKTEDSKVTIVKLSKRERKKENNLKMGTFSLKHNHWVTI